ncbi:MAG TPA: rhomboid family intramembrane serine protease [Chitinophagaceae bacterium]|nr:rhomboid family intramembrane serine protease [Chitinophagaceae bacterium]
MEITTITIIVLTCIISFIGFSNPIVINKLILWPALMKEKSEYYRLVTSGLIHANWGHLIFNMLTLYFFGPVVEVIFGNSFGTGVYLLFYVLALIISDIPTLIKYRNYPNYRSLGASGAISSVLFASIIFDPWNRIYIFFIPIGIPAFIFGLVYLGYCMYMSRQQVDGINHSAHFWGALFGIAFPIMLNPGLINQFIRQIGSGAGG